jgi:hypothetical protein
LTLNSFYFKPSAPNNFTITETPRARPVENASITESDIGFPFEENNLADEIYRNNMFGSTGATNKLTSASNPFEVNQSGLNSNFDDMEFKSGGEFIDQIEKDEAENRKEFASNNLSVAADSTSSNGSGDSLGSNEKWWTNANNLQQMSKLDLSNVSYLNELNATNNSHNSSLKRSLNKCDETETGEHDNTKKLKQKVDVFDYFNKKSGLPEYLTSGDVGVDFNSTKQDEAHDKTICDDKQPTSKNETESNEDYDSDNITLSVSKSVNLPSADNFSFTFNSSETGEFIQKKLPNSSKKKISPFQLSKMLPPQNTGANKTKTSISLKTIGEELDRVQNRLATNAIDSSSSSSKPINEPFLSSSLKTSSLKSAPSMDETISSINSSDMTAISASHKNKAEHGGINPKKVNLSSTTTSSVSAGPNQGTSSASSSKNKPNSGSLTSTPSKMVKSVSESSSLSTISTTSINKSSQDNTNQLFSQDSFISSIPERANDSTLIGNHHHHHHHLSKHKQKSSTQLNAQSKLKKQRNAEIQTSPDQQHTSSSSTSITTTRSDSNDSKSLAYTKLNDFKNASQEEANNRASISSISSANELSSNQLTTQLSAINSLASLLSQGNSCSGTNAPLIAIFQMPSIQNDASTNKSQFESSRSSMNQAQFMKLNPNLFVDTAMSANSSSAVTPTLAKPNLTNQSISAQLKPTELPEIDLNAKEIDFGLIAEGCTTYFRLFFKILNLSSLMNGFLQVELDDCVNWRIEPTDLDDHSYSSSKSSFYNSKKESSFKMLKKRFNDMTLRARFRKTLSLHAEKPVANNTQALDCQSQLKFDLSSCYYELFVNLDTKELKFFKDILSSYDEQFDPCLIKAQLYIYHYAGGNAHDGSINSTSSSTLSSNKKLIQMVDLRYVLGYAKLRTQANMNEIELAVDEDSHHEDSTLQCGQQKRKAAYYKDDIDQTMTSSCDILEAKSKLDSTLSVESIVPLSNAGNLNIEVDCYFSYEENGITQSKVNALLFRNYELRLFEYNIYLDHKVKQKSCARLYLSRVDAQTMGSAALTHDANKTKLIVEVKPNGFRYELPVHVSFKSKGSHVSLMRSISQCSFSQQEVSKKMETDVKLASSKSILFFGRTLMSSKNITVNNAQENGLVNEFTISNSNDFVIRSQIALIIKENGSSESNENKPTRDQRGIPVYFRFSSELKSIPKLVFNEQMTSLNVNLEPKESLTLKIKFCPPISANSYVEQPTVSGVVRMNITGFTKRFNVHLVGFLKEAFLDVQNAASLDQRMSNEENQLEQILHFRNIKNLRYSTQLFNTNGSAMNKTYRKVLKLSNFSNTNSKCLVYPVLYDNKLNMEVLSSESVSNEKCYELGFDSDGYMNKFKLLFDMNLSRFKIDSSSLSAIDFTNNELAWFELRPNGEFCIVLELTSTMIQEYKPHKSSFSNSQPVLGN